MRGTREFPCHVRGGSRHFLFEMVVCAWCESVIAARPASRAAQARPAPASPAADAVSHGMCPSCRDTHLAAMPRIAPAALGALAR